MGHDVSLSENVALSELKFKWALHSGYRLLLSIFINCIQPGSILKEQFNILGYILYFLTKINDIIVMFMQQLNSQPYGGRSLPKNLRVPIYFQSQTHTPSPPIYR